VRAALQERFADILRGADAKKIAALQI